MNDKPLEPWFIADPSGKVLSAHCTCVAGLGETCSHVAAILFTVDVANKIKENRLDSLSFPFNLLVNQLYLYGHVVLTNRNKIITYMQRFVQWSDVYQ